MLGNRLAAGMLIIGFASSVAFSSRDEPSARHSPVALNHGRVLQKFPRASPGPWSLSTDGLAQISLADRYKAGRIVIAADENWTSSLPANTVFESRGDLVVAPDGSVFISNTTQNTIFKFDPAGKFLRTIGRSGNGPGDLNFPGRLSILDGKFLVVGEYATNQRISLFDLDGKFAKIVKTGRSAFKPIALKDGKIAYTSMNGRIEKDEMINIEEVFIRDAWSGAEKSVVRHEIRNRVEKMPGGGLVSAASGAIVMTRTHEGGLVVGTTQSAKLDVFSVEGAKVRTIDLGWKPIPVTPEYRERAKALIKREDAATGHKSFSKDPLLPEYLEILQDIWTDAEGNLLVCRKTDCQEDCPLSVRAYSPEGDLVGDFEIVPGPFVLSADWRFKRIALTGNGLFGLLEFKDDPDGYLHLIRSNYR
jgi:hypothetical protein